MATTSFRRRSPFTAETASLAPSYHTTTTTDGIELNRLDSGSGSSSGESVRGDADSPPPYYGADGSSASFTPTVWFQIQTTGKPLLSLPVPPKPEPIPVYKVSSSTGIVEDTDTPAYLSLRHSRGSGSCRLVAVSAAGVGGGAEESATVSRTTYRFGPGRYPQVEVCGPGHASSDDIPQLGSPAAESSSTALQRRRVGGSESSSTSGYPPEQRAGGEGSDEGQDEEEEEEERRQDQESTADAFSIKPRGLLTRSQTFRTHHLGAFEWRYASRKERKALGASSLLVLDRVVRVFQARNAGQSTMVKEVEERTPVARFIRNSELRTRGTSASSAGNGGRLQVDLSLWREEEKEKRRMVEVLAITTCICMLKKEVDRRRRQQICAMAVAAS